MAFESISTLQIRGRILDLSTPRVMGIINMTKDSFFADSRQGDASAALKQAARMIAQGADILDLGGASSRPGSRPPEENQEMDAILPAVNAIREKYDDIPISIDTYRATVASAALKAGADMINDITAGTADSEMLSTVSDHNAAIVLMHMQGKPDSMQDMPNYVNVVSDIAAYLSSRVEACREAGIKDIIIDPGIGFGKKDEHNFRLLKELSHFRMLGLPMMVGISRKSMIQRTLEVTAEDALNGTTALHMATLINGASILRVHDVKEAVQCVSLYKAMQSS